MIARDLDLESHSLKALSRMVAVPRIDAIGHATYKDSGRASHRPGADTHTRFHGLESLGIVV